MTPSALPRYEIFVEGVVEKVLKTSILDNKKERNHGELLVGLLAEIIQFHSLSPYWGPSINQQLTTPYCPYLSSNSTTPPIRLLTATYLGFVPSDF